MEETEQPTFLTRAREACQAFAWSPIGTDLPPRKLEYSLGDVIFAAIGGGVFVLCLWVQYGLPR